MSSQGQEAAAHKVRVLVVTHEPLRTNLSGPGIRALEIGRALSRQCTVSVATPYEPEIQEERCMLVRYSFDEPRTLTSLAEQADVLLVQGFTLSQFPSLAELCKPTVVDLYCPFTIEHLEMMTSRLDSADPLTGAMEADAAGVLAVQNAQLALGDFFICATERQRDFWIGALHTAGRINPQTYRDDCTLRSLIDVVPFGLPEQRFGQSPTNVMKGVRPGIGVADHVLVWAGSILDWQDPHTLVRAVAALATTRSDIKLFFMGTRHPNPQVPRMRAVDESIALATELGVLDTHVFFNDWVPYAERWRYLTEADLGLSTHRDHFETRISFRTRMLDYLWTGLPIVCTEGDAFAALVSERHLGAVVPPGDVSALASAIERLIDNPGEREACRVRLLKVAEEFRWERVVRPLVRFCEAPRLAPDHLSRQRAMQRRIAHGFRATRWLKRRAQALGVSQRGLDRLKALGPVRVAMHWLNRLAIPRSN